MIQRAKTQPQDPERAPSGRRVGPILAAAGGLVLLLGMVGAVADMIISSGTEVRGESGNGGPVEVQARNFAFVPNSVVVHGSSVTIRLTNDGVSDHSFTVDEPLLDVVVHPGQTRTVTVNAPGSDLVRFYCRFHLTYDMRGTIGFNR